jgi:hypothetical protein
MLDGQRKTPISGDGPVRVVLWGLGAMGKLMARLVLSDPDLKLVGGISKRLSGGQTGPGDIADIAGLNRPTGVAATASLAEALARSHGADVVLHATGSFVSEVKGEIESCLEHGLDVITIAEEMSYPWAARPDLADQLDRLARARGCTIVGTGVNPGFILDTLITVLTVAIGHVEFIHAKRVNDLSPYGPTVMRTQGVGLAVEEFKRGVDAGTVVGHVGFPESLHLIAKSLGVELSSIEQSREPIISSVRRETPHVVVQPGYVAGCRHSARGYVDGRLFIELEHPQQVRPEAEGVETGDFIRIEGYPSVSFRTGPELPGGIATAATAVNMIRPVVASGPGLLTMLDFPLPRGSARRSGEVAVNG